MATTKLTAGGSLTLAGMMAKELERKATQDQAKLDALIARNRLLTTTLASLLGKDPPRTASSSECAASKGDSGR